MFLPAFYLFSFLLWPFILFLLSIYFPSMCFIPSISSYIFSFYVISYLFLLFWIYLLPMYVCMYVYVFMYVCCDVLFTLLLGILCFRFVSSINYIFILFMYILFCFSSINFAPFPVPHFLNIFSLLSPSPPAFLFLNSFSLTPVIPCRLGAVTQLLQFSLFQFQLLVGISPVRMSSRVFEFFEINNNKNVWREIFSPENSPCLCVRKSGWTLKFVEI